VTPRRCDADGASATGPVDRDRGHLARARSIGFNCLRNLENFGFDGEIALVSRSRSEVSGRPCAAQIDDLPSGVDAALLCLPRAGIVDALEACVRRGIGGAVSFASGFAETGERGRREQARIARSRATPGWRSSVRTAWGS